MLAYKDISYEQYESYNQDIDLLESDLTLLNVFGIRDIIKPEVPRAIQVCKEAGITTIMCTGDSLETAKVIAYECGILLENDTNDIADP